MTEFGDLLRGVRWRRTLLVSLASIAVGGVVFARGSAPLVSAVSSPSAASLGEAPFTELMPKHAEHLATSQRRFNGRSFFHMPIAPPQPPAPRPPRAVDPPPQEPIDLPPAAPPGPPAEYAGPKQPFGMIGNLVFFDDGEHLYVGEEDQGVRVVSVNAPWSVTLAWSGGEYERPVTFGPADAHFRNALEDLVDLTSRPPPPPERAAPDRGASRPTAPGRSRATPTARPSR